MNRKINIRLSAESVDKAITRIQKYEASILKKSKALAKELAKVGVNVIKVTVSGIPSEESDGATGNYLGVVQETADSITVAYALEGDKAAFIEFSAGITYGSPPGSYPLPSGSGMGMGTYNPNSDNWENPKGWWYGNGKHTFGNPAYMPVYHSTVEVTREVERVAKEVFG